MALSLSLLGSGVWLVAVVWQVIELRGGPIELSFVAALASLGLTVTVLFGGVVADRVSHKHILITVETTKSVAIAVGAALALSGTLEIWHLAIISLVLGIADGFFYPAYSALLPTILPAEQLLAANGVEGVLRPAVMQAAGPALASAAIAAFSPGIAFAVTALSQAIGVGVLSAMRGRAASRDEVDAAESADAAGDNGTNTVHPIRALFHDLGEGFSYMWKTPWLLGTLLFAPVLILIIMGPIEVLLPFAVKNQTGGGAGAFALALAAFGVGGAAGSLLIASLPLPRRYLTLMVLLWGGGCLPLAIIGITDNLWLMVIALFVVGFAFSAATVIWGTLLQRRVPRALLGRISSLDFFMSLAFTPVSMALAGPVAALIGIAPTFAIAGLVSPLLAVATVFLAGMPRDEIAHPLEVPTANQAAGAEDEPGDRVA